MIRCDGASANAEECALVELLVSNGDGPALAALVLQESKDSGGRNCEHEDIAWALLATNSYRSLRFPPLGGISYRAGS